MVKHNNMIVNNHFRKDWDKRVRTWFNQPARKLRRREARKEKAKAIFPRPVAGALRPVVHCPTSRYNLKVRLGRGFSLEELRAAGLTALEAKSIGIAVDYRRANKSSESINVNAQRLKFYKANLVVYPRKSKAVAAHRKEEPKLPAPVQRTEPVAFKTAPKRDRPTKITAEMKAVSGFKTFRSERMKIRKLGLAASKAHAEATGRK